MHNMERGMITNVEWLNNVFMNNVPWHILDLRLVMNLLEDEEYSQLLDHKA